MRGVPRADGGPKFFISHFLRRFCITPSSRKMEDEKNTRNSIEEAGMTSPRSSSTFFFNDASSSDVVVRLMHGPGNGNSNEFQPWTFISIEAFSLRTVPSSQHSCQTGGRMHAPGTQVGGLFSRSEVVRAFKTF
jgi:hypothetical protein